MFYQLESTTERRNRKHQNIKTLFMHLTIEEGMSFMEAYEAVGYVFYEQADAIRKILAAINKKWEKFPQPIQIKAVILHRLSKKESE